MPAENCGTCNKPLDEEGFCVNEECADFNPPNPTDAEEVEDEDEVDEDFDSEDEDDDEGVDETMED